MNQLKTLRWGVRGVLLLGVAASVVANVLHANPNPISQSIAAWPPLALLLTVELISRVPAHHESLAIIRMTAAACIAGIAAWVSYGHMVGVATRYGETGASPYLIPVSVDGLIVVASICLVEIGGRISSTGPVQPVGMVLDYRAPIGPEPEPAPEPVAEPAPEPLEAPAPAPATPRRTPRVLTAAQRVAAAHKREPGATNARIAGLADVSVSTVKRYRPAGSPSAPDAAETPEATGSAVPVPTTDLVGAAA